MDIDIAYIEDRCIVDPNTGCWLWTLSLDNWGYARLNGVMLNGRRVKNARAHRVVYEIVHGPIADDVLICHRCDTPACANPQHLFAGSGSDNMKDMAQKRRHPLLTSEAQRGVNNPRARLTEAQVREIRASTEKLRDLSARYGVTMAMISAIRLGKSWTHVT